MFAAFLFMLLGAVYCAPSDLQCPVPPLLENGIFVFQEDNLLRYVCHPGYVLLGKEINRCIEGKWEEQSPTCLDVGLDENDETSLEETFEDLDDEREVNEVNSTAELPLSDEPSVKKQSQKSKKKSKTDSKIFLTTVEDENVKLPSLPTDAVSTDEEGYQSDEGYYWYAHYYPYAAPGVMTVTDSQLAWINSLHPELRDQYLRGMHVIRVPDTDRPKKMESLTTREPYNYIYSVPYVRRPVSLIVDNVPSTYDYSCNRAGYPVIPAPRLPNMRVARYDSRKNIYEPHNYYLSAIYQCEPGYYMLDSRFTELYCSRGQWVGQTPVCVPNP